MDRNYTLKCNSMFDSRRAGVRCKTCNYEIMQVYLPDYRGSKGCYLGETFTNQADYKFADECLEEFYARWGEHQCKTI